VNKDPFLFFQDLRLDMIKSASNLFMPENVILDVFHPFSRFPLPSYSFGIKWAFLLFFSL